MSKNIVINIPDEIREEIKEDFDHDQLTLRIERLEDYKNWERYSIRFLEEQDEDDIILQIQSEAMDISREIEKNGGGPVEEFIICMLIEQIRKHEKGLEYLEWAIEAIQTAESNLKKRIIISKQDKDIFKFHYNTEIKDIKGYQNLSYFIDISFA